MYLFLAIFTMTFSFNFFASLPSLPCQKRVINNYKSFGMDPEVWDRLLRPKQEPLEELIVPAFISKQLTREEKNALFDRLSRPKSIVIYQNGHPIGVKTAKSCYKCQKRNRI